MRKNDHCPNCDYHHTEEPKFLVEARREDGSLRFDGDQPPREWITGVTEWTMAQYYYRLHPGNHLVDMQTIYDYFHSRGWKVRPKTW